MNYSSFKRTAAGLMSLALVLGSAGLFPAEANAAAGGVTINEVCAKNDSYTVSGGLYDWVELYNSSASAVDISGWGLTDKASKPYRYTFPEGSVIPAGGRLTVCCDQTAGAADSSFAPFGLSATGETITLTDKSGTVADTVSFDALAADTSYGQYPDGSGEYYVLPCSPDAANTAPEGSNAVRLPEFSEGSGFYGSEFQLTLTAAQGCTIYYTTDGSDPTTESKKYTAPISIADCSSNPNVYSARTDISASDVTAPSKNVDKAAIIRAVAVDGQGRVSDIVTQTYFVGKTNGSYYKDMKVVSIVTDPDNLFDYEKGIYVKGKVFDEENQQQGPGWGFGWGGGFGMVNPWEMAANYTQHGQEWERPASFELFENGKSVLSQNVGIRIKGAASRSSAQKSFNIFARKDYGKAELEYDFFEGEAVKEKNGKVIDKFDGITLRNGGNDNAYTFFRDSVNQALVSDRNMATQATSECIVFLDGEFWGIYQVMEKVNDDFISSHYGIDKKDAVIIKNGEVEEGTEQDKSDWDQLAQFCASSDMTSDANYAKVCQQLDIQSYMDYFAAQIYWNNTDWPQNNFAVWRSASVDSTNKYSDGKWRMFLFDTELSTGLYGNDASADRNSFERISKNTDNESRMFINLMKNEEFRDQFNITLMDLANYNFSEDRVTETSSYYEDNFRKQIVDTFDRFQGTPMFGGSNEDKYNTELNTFLSFYGQRFDRIMEHMKRSAGITGKDNRLTLNNQSAQGAVKVNTLTIDDTDKWEARYFSDQTLTITAVPKAGKSFKTWDASGIILTDEQMRSPELTLKLESDLNLTAVYEDALRGDYNGDGTVDVADIVTLQSYLKGKVKTISSGDMNADGKDDVYDLIRLRRAIFNK